VDIELADDHSHILAYCEAVELGNFNKALVAKGVTSSSAKLVYKAKDPVRLEDPEIEEQVQNLLHALHDDPDVTEVYHNICTNDDDDDGDDDGFDDDDEDDDDDRKSQLATKLKM
jgi:transcriptional/translational regulatory protein YebC/TACO1